MRFALSGYRVVSTSVRVFFFFFDLYVSRGTFRRVRVGRVTTAVSYGTVFNVKKTTAATLYCRMADYCRGLCMAVSSKTSTFFAARHLGTLFSGWKGLFKETKVSPNALVPGPSICGERFVVGVFVSGNLNICR